MIKYWLNSDRIREQVFLPKYYNPEIQQKLELLAATHDLLAVRNLLASKTILLATGDEIGKSAYGTGDIPFVRTSDIANWEIKTAPKQGVSQDIYDEYAKSQNVQEGDILLVRDGTYLIGANCFVTKIDKRLLYQSHILKLRVGDRQKLEPELLFLALNSRIVQKQIRSFQFTADIIDTIGKRLSEVVLTIPKDPKVRTNLIERTKPALLSRMKGKAFIKHSPKLMEAVLESGSAQPLDDFFALSEDEVCEFVQGETVTSEFGGFEYFWRYSDELKNSIMIPRYYEPSIQIELDALTKHCDLVSLRELRRREAVQYHTGDEIGKMAYGTGTIPFLRTSDFSNWEIKHDPKQSVSREIYNQYSQSQDVQPDDILLVRDGTYLVGSSCMVTKEDAKCLFCGGLYKIRAPKPEILTPYLLLGLLNSYIVKRQIRTKQFTRDVIDTIGKRFEEVYLPIPKSRAVRQKISDAVKKVVTERIVARYQISQLSNDIEDISGLN